MLWDVELGQSKISFNDHEGDVMSVSILPSVDPNMFISGSTDIYIDLNFLFHVTYCHVTYCHVTN